MKHQYEYRKAMDSIRVSEEWEDNMIQKLMNTENQAAKRSRRFPRLGLAAAAAIACLTIGAGEAEAATGAVSDFFAPLFGTAHTEIIDSIGYPIGVSDSAAGITVTADAIIGDTSNVCVVFSLRKDDGSAWTEFPDKSYLNFEDSTLDFDVVSDSPNGWGAHGSSWFLDEDPDRKVIRFVEQRTVENGTPKGRAKEVLKNLCVWDDETQKSRVIAKGKWTLRFDMGFENLQKHFPVGQTVEFLDMPATVTDITFSPIAFRVAILQDRTEFAYSGDERYLDGNSEALDQLAVILKLRDGREIDLGYWAGGGLDHPADGQTELNKSGLFDEIIPLEDMESVVVCGTEIPLR